MIAVVTPRRVRSHINSLSVNLFPSHLFSHPPLFTPTAKILVIFYTMGRVWSASKILLLIKVHRTHMTTQISFWYRRMTHFSTLKTPRMITLISILSYFADVWGVGILPIYSRYAPPMTTKLCALLSSRRYGLKFLVPGGATQKFMMRAMLLAESLHHSKYFPTHTVLITSSSPSLGWEKSQLFRMNDLFQY